MQIVNPLRAALPYITLQTAKVQHCWADYFIFRGFAGAAGRFGSAETRRRSLRQPPQAAGPAARPRRPAPAPCTGPEKIFLCLLQIILIWYIILP